MKKVLVGCPTSFHKEHSLKEYSESIKNLSYKNYDILLVDNSPDDKYTKKIKSFGLKVKKGPYFESARERIVFSRNILKDEAIKNYDYFLSLEQDVIPPKNIIERMLNHEKKVITGIYFARNIVKGKKVLMPLVYKEINSNKKLPDMRSLNELEIGNGLIQVVSCGLGCVLIHKDVLKKITFRYEKDKDAFDDRFFCIDLYNKNIPIYCDTSIICKHLILNRPYQWRDIKK
nr:glycosyltransferase family 2 protein [Candidatus Woesearchaeota archaeon]